MAIVLILSIYHTGVEYCLFEHGLPEPLPDKRIAPHFFVYQRVDVKKHDMKSVYKEAWTLFYRNLMQMNSDYPELVYKYQSFSLNSLYALKKHALWFSRHEDFNDPFEGLLAPPQKQIEELVNVMVKDANIERLKLLEAEYLSVFDPYLKNQRICCFSKKNDDICLWSHYADEHRGFCLEFNVLENIEFFMPLFPVVYARDFAPADLWNSPGKILEQLFQRKSAAWRSEEEVRIIKKGKVGLRTYRPGALKRIIFGCRASSQNIDLVRSIMPANVRFAKAELSKNSYRLNISDI